MKDLATAEVEEVAVERLLPRYYIIEKIPVVGGFVWKRIDDRLYDTIEDAEFCLYFEKAVDLLAHDLKIEATSCDCQDPKRGLKSAYCWEHQPGD